MELFQQQKHWPSWGSQECCDTAVCKCSHDSMHANFVPSGRITYYAVFSRFEKLRTYLAHRPHNGVHQYMSLGLSARTEARLNTPAVESAVASDSLNLFCVLFAWHFNEADEFWNEAVQWWARGWLAWNWSQSWPCGLIWKVVCFVRVSSYDPCVVVFYEWHAKIIVLAYD